MPVDAIASSHSIYATTPINNEEIACVFLHSSYERVEKASN
ncbi:MAG: hypothetical protein V3Q69_06615 [Burkholderia sp.]